MSTLSFQQTRRDDSEQDVSAFKIKYKLLSCRAAGLKAELLILFSRLHLTAFYSIMCDVYSTEGLENDVNPDLGAVKLLHVNTIRLKPF